MTYSRDYHLKNKEKALQWQREYRKKKHDEELANRRRYDKENHDHHGMFHRYRGDKYANFIGANTEILKNGVYD